MEKNTMKHLVLHEYGKNPVLKEGNIPQLKENEFLIKVQASTVNPSDRLFIGGDYFKKELPTTCGIEGTGRVVKVNGQDLQGLLNKRLCFIGSGTWTEYLVMNKASAYFEIDQDVPLCCAASGIVNPLTVLGFYYTMKQGGKKGIIHTAAASSLGRQLNRFCISKGIPLLNIVRRKEHVDTLKKQGAQHIINTSDENWPQQFSSLIAKHGFDCLFDALGGGPVSSKILGIIPPTSKVHIYGALQNQPLTIKSISILSGLKIDGFMLFSWWPMCSNEIKEEIKKNYSKYLKSQLSSLTYKELGMEQIEQALQLSVSKASEGKILLKFA